MNDKLNPYASPELPEDPGTIDLSRPIVLQFEFDRSLQWASALSFRGRREALSTAACWLLIAAGIFVGRSLGELAWRIPTDADDWPHLVWGGLFLSGFVATVSLLAVVNRLLAWPTLRRLRQHPLLSGLGDWQITLAETEVTVETPRGKQSWPLAKVRYQEQADDYAPTLWLEPDLPIALPISTKSKLWPCRPVRIAFRSRITPIRPFETWRG